MTLGLVQEHNLEKHIGCMAGFLHIFDRHQLLAGKRIYSAKRLPPAVDSSSESEQSYSPAVSKELGKPQKVKSVPSPYDLVKKFPTYDRRSSEVEKPAENPTKSLLPLPVIEFKEGTRSSWKLSREAPRLSLDSRATFDAKGSLYRREIRSNAANLSANRAETCGDGEEIGKRRSTSVIARLMGLEPPAPAELLPEKKAALRRSASESRVSKDFINSQFLDGNSFHTKPNQSSFCTINPNNAARNGFDREERVISAQPVDSKEYSRPEKAQTRGLGQRKNFFDSQDIFPEPKQSATIYGEIERRLKMRGIDEASNDLETLKQILEALQLKGLLHSAKPSNQRNFVHDQRFSGKHSPIVLVTPARSHASANRLSRNFHDSPPSSFRSRPGSGRNLNLKPEIDRNARNQARSRSPSPSAAGDRGLKTPYGRKPLNNETQRNRNKPTEQRRLSPVQSPKFSQRRPGSEQPASNRSPINRKPTADKDESSSMSESSIGTPSQTDTGGSKREYKEGKSLLERCDQLLLSIAEITATELQPSPVSVLDSCFYRDDSSSWSPSPVTKRSIDFKELQIELDEDVVEDNLEDSDFSYISEIFRVSGFLPEDSDVFQELENQQFLKGKDTSNSSVLHRKLIFDTITEILDRNRQLSTWKVVSNLNLQETWSEFTRIRERDTCDDLFELICRVLHKDFAGDAVAGWVRSPIEMFEAVLDIERLLFKDLVGETIRELSSFGGNWSNTPSLRRKLVF